MLHDKLTEDMKTAMKARDTLKTQVLRMVLSDCKYARVAKGSDLDDSDVIQVVKKAVKSRLDSVQQFRDAGRDDLADKEAAEVEVLKDYVPQAMSAAELEPIVAAALQETGAASMKDMGRVMKAVLSAHGDRVDGKMVQQLVAARLKGN